jgi:putative DNA primase/helicase
MLNAAKAAFSGVDGLLFPPRRDWNEPPTWLPCPNGTVDLDNGRLMASRPDHYFNRAVEWEYRGLDEPCPNWLEMVSKILGRDARMIDYVEHIIGSAACGFQPKHLVIAMGPKANNGKSLFFSTIARCLGDFSREIAVDLLLKQNNKSSSAAHPEILRLRWARLAMAQESDSSDVLDTGQVKLLTSGGDAREERTLHSEKYQKFEQTHTLIIHTNKPPRLSEGDRGLANRLVIIPFNTLFVPPEQQPEDPANNIYHAVDRYELERTFTLEMSGILAWLVRCAMKFLANGRRLPPPPPMVADESANYMIDNDIVSQFKTSMCMDTPGTKIGARELYRSFRKWCEEVKDMTSKEIISSTRFGREAKSHFQSKHINGHVVYYDITLRFQPVEDDDTLF